MKRKFLSAIYLGSVSLVAISVVHANAQDTVRLRTLVAVDEDAERKDDLEVDVEITQDDIEKLQPADLKQLFSQTPSVTVSGGSAASQKFYVHGIDEAKLNVTIDGARQKNNVWHHNGNIGINPLFLKSVAINEGVAPADVGPGALGGAVQFETVGAGDLLQEGRTSGGFAFVGYDTNAQTYTLTGAAYQALNGFEILGAVTRAEGDDYSDGSGMTEPGTAADLWNGLGKLSYQSADGHRVDLSAEYYQDDGYRRLRLNMGDVVHPTGTGGLFNDNLYERLTTTVKYSVEGAEGNFDPEVLFYYNFNKLFRPENPGFPGPAGDFNSDVQSFGGHVQNTFHLQKGDVTAGLDFYNDHSEIERFYFATDATENVSNVGAFVQARFEPANRWELSTGLRADYQSYRTVDHQTFDNFGVSPNVNIGYELLDGLTARAGYAYVFGGIEQADIAIFHAADHTYSADVNPTYAHNAKVGLDYTRGGLTLGANLFYIEIIDPVAWSPADVRINGDDLVSQGFDLYARYDWPQAYISAGFSYADVKYGDRVALSGDYDNGVPVGSILTLGAGYTFEQYDLTIGANAEIAFEYSNDDLDANFYTNPLPGYQVVDVFAQWKPKVNDLDLTLRAEVTNLFNDTYYSRATFSEFAVGPIAVTPVNSPGRSFGLAVTSKF